MRSLLFVLLVSFIFAPAYADEPRYSEVIIRFDSPETAASLARAGVGLDHALISEGTAHAVLSRTEIGVLEELGIPFEVLIEDLSSWYENRAETDYDLLQSQMKQTYPVEGFEFGSMGGFYTFDEVVRELDSMRTLYPDLVTVKQSVGSSLLGRPVWMVKISDNADIDEDEAEVLYTALHHAREPQGMATVIYFMYYLLENYGIDPEVADIVDNRELYFIPVVNPDGYLYNQQTNPNGGGMWRKNRRDNGDGTTGVDLNRNYGYQWGYDDQGSSPFGWSETYRGSAPFSEPETQVIRDFAEGHSFLAALNYHSYGDLLIYPWGYIGDFETEDSPLFTGLSADMTQFNGYTYGTANQTVGYLVNGEANDWFYGEQATKPKVFAMTPEVGGFSDGFWPNPNRIYPLAEENLYPNLQLAKGPGAIFANDLRLSSQSGNGQFQFTIDLSNESIVRQPIDFWLSITGPNDYSALIINRSKAIGPGGAIVRSKNYTIPNDDLGLYELTLSIGEYPDVPWLTDSEVYDKTSQTVTEVGDDSRVLPTATAVEQNYPNPFNPETSIRYALSKSAHVSLTVYNMIGQKIATLMDRVEDAGFHTVRWQGKNDSGVPVPSGLYLYRLVAGDYVSTRTMILLK